MQRAHSSAFRTSYEIQIIESNSQKYVNEVDMVLFSVLVTVPSRQSTSGELAVGSEYLMKPQHCKQTEVLFWRLCDQQTILWWKREGQLQNIKLEDYLFMYFCYLPCNNAMPVYQHTNKNKQINMSDRRLGQTNSRIIIFL